MTAALWFLTGLAAGLLWAHRVAVLARLVAAVDWLTTDPPPRVAEARGARNVRLVERDGGAG